MASYARDIYFGVRVEDRATRPLRRIARDMQMLGKQGLARRQQVATQAGISARTATAARVRAQAELASLQTGSRAFALEKQRAAVAKMDLMNKYRTLGLDKEAESLTKRELRNAAQLSMYARGKGFPRGAPQGSEARTLLQKAALAEQKEIAVAQQLLYRKSGIVVGALTEQTLAEQRLIAVEGERIAREAQLTAEIETRAMAEGVAAARSAEAIKAVNSFRVDRLKGIAMYVRHIGSALATVGAVGVFAFAALGKAAADFSTQVTLASTQTAPVGARSITQIQKNAAFIQKAIQKQLASGRVIATPQEQTGATYRIFSGTSLPGKQKQQLKEGIGLLREFNQVTTANVGLVKLDEVVSAGLTILNRFRVPLKQMPKELNTMQAAVRFGNINLSQFISAMNTAAPAAQSAGYSFTDVSAAVAFLSRQFTSSRMAATGYARLLQIFARPDIIKGLHGYGVEITHVVNGVHQLLPIQEIAARVVQRFGGNVKAGSLFLQNFFKAVGGTTQGTIQATRVLISYVQHHREASAILRQVTRDHYELKRSLEAAQASPGVRWQEFVNQLKALGLEIGTGVLPAVAALSDHVRRLAGWFNGLSPTTKRAIGYFGAFISVFTLLGGILLTAVGGFFSLALALGAFSGAAVEAEGATALLGSEAGFAFPEVMLVLGAIAGLIALYRKYPKQTIGVIQYTKKMVKELAALDKKLLDLVAHPWKIFVDVNIKIPKGVSNFFKKFGSNAFKDAVNTLPGGKLVTALYDFWKNTQKAADAKLGAVKVPRKVIDRFHHRDSTDQARQLKKAADNAAAALGTTDTPGFRKLFDNLVKAKRHYNELKAAGASQYKLFLAQMKVADASTALESGASKQQAAAAEKAATAAAALSTNHKKYSDKFIIDEARKVAALSKTARHEKTYAAWKAYYAALDKLQNNASNSQLSAVEKMFNLTDSATDKAAKKAEDKAKKHAQRLKQIYQQMLSNLQNQYQTFDQQNQNLFGQLFQGPHVQSAVVQNTLQAGGALTKTDLLKDARSQVTRFANIQKNIGKLRGRGLPETLLQQIETLGPEEAQKMLALINKMTPNQIREYSRLWKKGQKEVHDATMRDVKAQLHEWRKHGRRIGLAIAAGLRDENTALEKSLRELIAKAFPELARKSKHTPARTTPGRVHSTGTKAQPRTENHTHYHVTAPKSDHPTIKKQLDAANWHHRTRQK